MTEIQFFYDGAVRFRAFQDIHNEPLSAKRVGVDLVLGPNMSHQPTINIWVYIYIIIYTSVYLQ